MDGLQGAVLSVKLKHLPAWNEGRRKNAALYGRLLAGVKNIILPTEASYGKHVYHIYAIRAQSRDALIKTLQERDVHCAIHYPVPLHLQDAYSSLGYKKGDFPVTERVAEGLVSLPMFAELTKEQIETAAQELKRCVAGAA